MRRIRPSALFGSMPGHTYRPDGGTYDWSSGSTSDPIGEPFFGIEQTYDAGMPSPAPAPSPGRGRPDVPHVNPFVLEETPPIPPPAILDKDRVIENVTKNAKQDPLAKAVRNQIKKIVPDGPLPAPGTPTPAPAKPSVADDFPFPSPSFGAPSAEELREGSLVKKAQQFRDADEPHHPDAGRTTWKSTKPDGGT